MCAGMHGCVLGCVGVHGCEQVYMGVLRYAQVCVGVRKCAWVCQWKCAGVCECVCWMNFQNIFWRLESIHQRTLIHIVYEFFMIVFKVKVFNLPSRWPT